MSLLYVNEDGASIGVDSNRLAIKYADGLLRSVPIETVDSITILGQAQLTTNAYGHVWKEGFLWRFSQRAEDILAIFILRAMWMRLFKESRAPCMMESSHLTFPDV